MRHEPHQPGEFLRKNRPLIERIVAITSQRRSLSATDRDALSAAVESRLAQPDTHDGLGRFRGASSLRSYLVVVVQRLYRMLTTKPANASPSEGSPLLKAIRQTTSTLPSREALVVRMWFESGMTTQKIATVLGMRPSDVHAVIAKRTDGVQHRLAQSQISSLTILDSEESS
jgi:hypothetical protein